MAVAFESLHHRAESLESLFFGELIQLPGSDTKVLESYHRFYKTVSKSLFPESKKELALQMLPFEDWVDSNGLVDKLTDEMKAELSFIWSRAERLDEVQTIVRSFNQQTSNFTLPLKRDSEVLMNTPSNDCENHWQQISTKLDELLQNQKRMEQRIAFSRTPEQDSSIIELMNHDLQLSSPTSSSKPDSTIKYLNLDQQETRDEDLAEKPNSEFLPNKDDSTYQNQSGAFDLFKEEFCHDIWKVQENIVTLVFDNCEFHLPKSETSLDQVRKKRLYNNDEKSLLSISDDLKLNDCEQLESLII